AGADRKAVDGSRRERADYQMHSTSKPRSSVGEDQQLRPARNRTRCETTYRVRLSSAVVLRFPFPECCRRQYSDAVKRIQDQQVLITADNGRALAGARCRQHDVVIAIATNRSLQVSGHHQRERLLEQPKRRSHILNALAKLSRQDIAKLVEQWSRRDYRVM